MADQSPSVAPPHALPPIAVPTSLAAALRERYELIRETGRGGSATVYLARDLKHDRFVAIKVLNPDVGHAMGERFLREIQVSAGMQHPHILPTYDSGIADGRLYFVMPFVDGGSLRQRLDTATSLDLDEALRIARDIAVALAHAHALGVVHRDVKPENIMFYHGHACLADFGVARAIEQLDSDLTLHGTVVGTPAYMSPEQLSSAGFDGRSDVYSLACVLYEMIAGARLYGGGTAKDVLAERSRRPSIRKLRPRVPNCIDALLTHALAESPDQRFPDARTFAAAIEQAMKDVHEPERISAPKRALVTVREHKWAYGGVAALALIATVALLPMRRDGSLLLTRFRSDVAPGARDAFSAGRAALGEWNVGEAQRLLARAAALDPASPAAQLWLAQSYALGRKDTRSELRVSAMRLAKMRARLDGRDSLLAAGLVALGEGSYRAACDAYGAALRRDSLDVLAWYGLGDCQALDSTVIRSSASPSGWRFRSSWDAAARAYMRAVTLDPTAHRAFPYSMMSSLLPTDALAYRPGKSLGTPREAFAAFPSLDGDSVAFVPYPIATFSRVRIAPHTTFPDALRRNSGVLLGFARHWTSADLRSADAFEALGLAREVRGELGDDGAERAVRQARTLATSPAQRTRLAVAHVRIKLKQGQFEAARMLADSTLAQWDGKTPPSDVARELSPLAAFTGRVNRTAALANLWLPTIWGDAGIAPPVSAMGIRYFARAALGVCDDTLSMLRGNIDRLLESYAQPNRRAQIRTDAMIRASSLAYPCLGAAGVRDIAPMSPLDRAQRAHAQREWARVRSILDTLKGVRVVDRPGDISLDHVVQEAWLRAAIGDTAAAIRQLDLVLEALPTLSTYVTRDIGLAAAVGRAMTLRAELAAARHDVPTTQRWAGNALALWANADGPMQPTLRRLRTLASANR